MNFWGRHKQDVCAELIGFYRDVNVRAMQGAIAERYLQRAPDINADAEQPEAKQTYLTPSPQNTTLRRQLKRAPVPGYCTTRLTKQKNIQ